MPWDFRHKGRMGAKPQRQEHLRSVEKMQKEAVWLQGNLGTERTLGREVGVRFYWLVQNSGPYPWAIMSIEIHQILLSKGVIKICAEFKISFCQLFTMVPFSQQPRHSLKPLHPTSLDSESRQFHRAGWCTCNEKVQSFSWRRKQDITFSV